MTFEWSKTPPNETGPWWRRATPEGTPQLWQVYNDAGDLVVLRGGIVMNVEAWGGEWCRVATPEQVAVLSAALRDACDKCPERGGRKGPLADEPHTNRLGERWRILQLLADEEISVAKAAEALDQLTSGETPILPTELTHARAKADAELSSLRSLLAEGQK